MPTKKPAPKKHLRKPPPRKPHKGKGPGPKRVELTATREAVAAQLQSAFYVLINQAHKGENASDEQSQKASMFIRSWCRQLAQGIIHAAVEIENAEVEIQQLEMDLDYESAEDDDSYEARDTEYQIQNIEEEISYSEDDYWDAVELAVWELRKMGIDVDIKSRKEKPPKSWSD